ncbi:MAG: hypothetical protein HOW73_05645 [Polyangiaceae bacterium]|nr:hypothetical protein [Polyangiaceae bacterium]
MAILNLASFRDITVMPAEDVDLIESRYPGFVEKRIAIRESWMNARLKKRYAVPFSSVSPPGAAVGWIDAMVTLDCYLKRGFNPSSEQDALIKEAATTAASEILEAANSQTGLFDLPLREDAPGTSGVTQGGPLGYSEASPYEWLDAQSEEVSFG